MILEICYIIVTIIILGSKKEPRSLPLQGPLCYEIINFLLD